MRQQTTYLVSCASCYLCVDALLYASRRLKNARQLMEELDYDLSRGGLSDGPRRRRNAQIANSFVLDNPSFRVRKGIGFGGWVAALTYW